MSTNEALSDFETLMVRYQNSKVEQASEPMQGETVVINHPADPVAPDTLDKKIGRGLVAGGRTANRLAHERIGLWGTVLLASVLSSSVTYVVTHHHEARAMAAEPTVQVQLAGAAEGNA